MRIRTISVALGLLAIVVLTVLFAGLGQDTARGTGSSTLFGDGSDGPITFSTSAQFDPPADAVVDSGSGGGTALTVSSPSGAFVPGQRVLIHQTRGTGAGAWELNSVQSYTLGNMVTANALANSYSTSGANAAQILVVPQYTDLTVDAGVTVTAKAWDGSTGGILAFLADGTTTVAGAITANGTKGQFTGDLGGIMPGAIGGGFRGGRSEQANPAYGTAQGGQGEGTAGEGTNGIATGNGNGGGAAQTVGPSGGVAGGGGGHGIAGTDAQPKPWETDGIHRGLGAGTASTPDLTTMVFGGGGGGAANDGNYYPNYESAGAGGSGGGIIFLSSRETVTTGSITANGGAGSDARPDWGAGGGGAGGSILIKTRTGTFGSSLVSALGGAGGVIVPPYGDLDGGVGGVGRIRIEYCNTRAGGAFDPPADIAQISCKAQPTNTPTPTATATPTPRPPEINISGYGQYVLPKSCYDVRDDVQALLFVVCDNDFAGAPASHAACDDGNDTFCNDEDTTPGNVSVSVASDTYNVTVNSVPLNHTADTTKTQCDLVTKCTLTFTSTSQARPWNPWDVAGPGGSWPPDGVVDLPNDILGVIQNFCPNLASPCAKP